MNLPFIEYCRKYGVDHHNAVNSYVMTLMKMHNFIKKYGIEGKVDINHTVLQETFVDFYVDIARIKSNHLIKGLNAEKALAYKTYWLLRRKALQILSPFPGCEFINETFATIHLLAAIEKERNIVNATLSKNPTWKKFRDLLFRTFKFRHISQQSLELMIEAFFCGCDFAAGNTTTPPPTPPKK